ncbi:hypothetical protein ADUPG1_010422 [Aduncisulcus paluster]|uniref:Guanine nucleotide-binding protein subunit beta-like protein n=1 Tax=Aduncisulcus paluster TaxID=2918883 RepID=A0ABQ5JRB4_9EUKA|nr:hypothetical protein ADUPG1_010422 [Aduncisulcus paluster]
MDDLLEFRRTTAKSSTSFASARLKWERDCLGWIKREKREISADEKSKSKKDRIHPQSCTKFVPPIPVPLFRHDGIYQKKKMSDGSSIIRNPINPHLFSISSIPCIYTHPRPVTFCHILPSLTSHALNEHTVQSQLHSPPLEDTPKNPFHILSSSLTGDVFVSDGFTGEPLCMCGGNKRNLRTTCGCGINDLICVGDALGTLRIYDVKRMAKDDSKATQKEEDGHAKSDHDRKDEEDEPLDTKAVKDASFEHASEDEDEDEGYCADKHLPILPPISVLSHSPPSYIPQFATQCVSSLKIHPHMPNVLFCGNGDGSVSAWNIERENEFLVQTGHSQPVTGIYPHPDGSIFVSTSLDGVAQVWDMRTPNPVACLRYHTKGVTSVDGHPMIPSIMATSGFDGMVLIWDLRTMGGEPISRVFAHDSGVRGVKYLSSPCTDCCMGDEITRAESVSEDTLHECCESFPGFKHALIDPCSDSRDSHIHTNLVTVGSDGKMKIWNNNIFKTIHGDYIPSIEISAHKGRIMDLDCSSNRPWMGIHSIVDHSAIVTGGWDGTIKIWNW